MRSTMVYVQEIVRKPRPSRAWWRGQLATGGVLLTLFILQQWATCQACEGIHIAVLKNTYSAYSYVVRVVYVVLEYMHSRCLKTCFDRE